MLQGISQDQIPPSLEHSADNPTVIPVQAVDVDQLPREKGWTYDEMASVVGSLYLDSSHQMKIHEEQFSAIIEEYDKRIIQLKAEVQLQQENGESLRKQLDIVNRELEARNDTQRTRGHATSGHDGGDSLPDSR